MPSVRSTAYYAFAFDSSLVCVVMEHPKNDTTAFLGCPLTGCAPTTFPSAGPSEIPSSILTLTPSATPSLSFVPTCSPSLSTTAVPSMSRSLAPTAFPSLARPSVCPSQLPSILPTIPPTAAGRPTVTPFSEESVFLRVLVSLQVGQTSLESTSINAVAVEYSVAAILGIANASGAIVLLQSSEDHSSEGAELLFYPKEIRFFLFYSILVTILDNCFVARNTTPFRLAYLQQEAMMKAFRNGNLTETLNRVAAGLGAVDLTSAAVEAVNVTSSYLPPLSSPPTIATKNMTSESKSLLLVILIVGIVLAVVCLVMSVFALRAFRSQNTRSSSYRSKEGDEEEDDDDDDGNINLLL